jgi:hypothetical protein
MRAAAASEETLMIRKNSLRGLGMAAVMMLALGASTAYAGNGAACDPSNCPKPCDQPCTAAQLEECVAKGRCTPAQAAACAAKGSKACKATTASATKSAKARSTKAGKKAQPVKVVAAKVAARAS